MITAIPATSVMLSAGLAMAIRWQQSSGSIDLDHAIPSSPNPRARHLTS
jgi:hypothetical protein